MLQIIGLIVAVYAMVRLIQVPIEMTGAKEELIGLTFKVRFFIVAAMSAFGFLILGILTLILLLAPSNPFSLKPAPKRISYVSRWLCPEGCVECSKVTWKQLRSNS